MSSDNMKNIVLDTSDDWIVLDQRIKTKDGWVAGVGFIHEVFCEKAHVINENGAPMKFQKKNYINELHMELGHTLKAITRATENAMNLKLTGVFKACEDCALGKAKKAGVIKVPLER